MCSFCRFKLDDSAKIDCLVLILCIKFVKPLNLFLILNGCAVVIEVAVFGFLYLFPLSQDAGTYLSQCAKNEFHAQQGVVYLRNDKTLPAFFATPAFFPVLPAPLLAALLAVFVKGLCTVVVVEVPGGKLALAACTNAGRKSRGVHGDRLINS